MQANAIQNKYYIDYSKNGTNLMPGIENTTATNIQNENDLQNILNGIYDIYKISIHVNVESLTSEYMSAKDVNYALSFTISAIVLIVVFVIYTIVLRHVIIPIIVEDVKSFTFADFIYLVLDCFH